MDKLQTAITNPQNPNDPNFWDFLPRKRNRNQPVDIQEQEVEEEEVPLLRRNVNKNNVNEAPRRGTQHASLHSCVPPVHLDQMA